jgi:hypothetical protein
MTSTRSFSPISESLWRRALRVDLWGVQAVQQEVHLAEQVRERLGLVAEERPLLHQVPIGHGPDLRGEVLEGLDEEPAGAGRRVEHRLAQAWVRHGDHESHDRPWRVELAGVAGRIAHLAQQGLV